MTTRSLFSFGALLLALGLSAGCASGTLPQHVGEVNDIFAARNRPDLAVSVPGEDEDWEKTAAEVPKLLSKPLDADGAVRIALAQNRELRAAFYEIGIARGRFVQAGLPPNPEIDLGVRRPNDPAQPLQLDIGIEYNLTGLLMLPLRKGVAEAELAAERLRVAGQVLDMAYATRTAFYAVQARQQELDLRVRALKAFQAGFSAAEELHRVGNLPEMDLATQRAAVESARVDVAEAENRLLDARENLNVALGLSGGQTDWTVEAKLPDPPAEALPTERIEQRAVAASFELQELEARMRVASKRAGLAQTEGTLPHISGGFHGERDELAWEIGGHVTVGLPIFDRNQGTVLSARSEFGAQRERYLATATSLRATTRSALNRVESAGRRARHYREAVLPAREKALAETLLQYNAMQVSVFQVLESQRQVTQSGLTYVETLLDYWNARAALDQILAGRHRGLALGPAGASRTNLPSGSDSAAAGH
ncbi:TolC family protein [Polyangium jinanense]|uniref:TolC family protein n=1 Tax=Polyangium jinanense TaxID=2829994 RepID=A0A9X3XDB2_9BACT|nr:TolC family protein [Polyangium jinanense]MDC3957410.1 TolC family protein [Polyangium jinanense]MDC3988202.1 TolC family protein [Polyangium jinanense]